MYEISRTGSLLAGRLANYWINLLPTARRKGAGYRVKESMGLTGFIDQEEGAWSEIRTSEIETGTMYRVAYWN